MNRPGPAFFLAVVTMTWFIDAAIAFSPPVDTTGNLRVRIDGPAEILRTDVPVEVTIAAENLGERKIEGTIRLGLIDGWQAEPAGPVPFSVGPKVATKLMFKVLPAKDSYSAHYPIHAFAQFPNEGQTLTAHPILIVQTKLPRVPRSSPVIPWQPIQIADNSLLGLAQLSVFRPMFEVFGEKPRILPVGWKGGEERTGASFNLEEVTLQSQSRQSLGMHPPWRDQHVGTMLVEFPLALPQTKSLRLAFGYAMAAGGKGDGVTFRVRVLDWDEPDGKLGKIVFQGHTDAQAWQNAAVDLTSFAGQKVRLQLESHPGPKNNTGWDHSYWAEPTLIIGQPSAGPIFPPANDTGSRLIGKLARGKRDIEVRLWPGSRGLLDAVVGFVDGSRRLFFQGFEVQVPDGRLQDPRSPTINLLEAKDESGPKTYQIHHRFQAPMGKFDLLGKLWIEQDVLRVKFELANTPRAEPWRVLYLKDVAAGPWSESVTQVYAGPGNVIAKPGPFHLGFDGHRLATSFVGTEFTDGWSLVQGVDIPPEAFAIRPSERHCSLHVPHAATWTFSPEDNVWEGARRWHDVNGLKAADGVERAAGRFVFDLWGGRYAESAAELRRAFRYGLTDALVVWHNWQRWGYDYRLPEIWPPNPRLGTLEEMQKLARTCKQAGVLFAPHDNYIDFYPDAEGFSYSREIAFTLSGQPVRAWLNEGRGAQSYRYRADRIEPYLKPNVAKIKAGLEATSFFIDVWSSAGPYDYWTADGQFRDRIHTRDTWGRCFQWIRDTLGNQAPQISESGHDQLIGWLDGAQTNHLRVDRPIPGKRSWAVWNLPCADAERIPWFDAAHHDRFILHGAGYQDRYMAGLDASLHGIFSDDYLATEVLTGHPAMVPRPFGRDVVRTYWLLHDLMRALALKRIENVTFADGDLHRQHVTWTNGETWVNRSPKDWQVQDTTLPEYGFLARARTDKGPVEVSIARRAGLIVEMARSPESLYVNGRESGEKVPTIRPLVTAFKDERNRRFSLDLLWEIGEPLPAGWLPFAHLCDNQGEIIGQAGFEPGTFHAAEKTRILTVVRGQVPPEVVGGTELELRIGLYRRGDGHRLPLAGPDDGTHRIRLGTLKFLGTGKNISGIAWKLHVPEPNPLLARQNPERKPIDFGPVITSGGCRFTHDGDALIITPLPADRPLRFEAKLRWPALPWQLPIPTHLERLSEDGQVLSREPIRREDGMVVVSCDEQTFCCRLTYKK